MSKKNRRNLTPVVFAILAGLLSASVFCKAPDAYNQKCRYIEKTRFRRVQSGPALEFIYMTIPPSDDYQEISNIDAHGGQIFDNPQSSERYVRYAVSDQDSDNWNEVVFEFDYIPKDTEFTKQVVDTIFPYDTSTELYKKYTSKYYQYLDTDNPTLKKAADKLWSQSENAYDYAEKCLNYVVDNFDFKASIPGARWHAVSELVETRVCDCGNLSSVLITLLRCKGVPARYVLVRGHVWAEFYLEKYGWIPADPTLKLFGQAPSNYGLIRSHELVYMLKTSETELFRSLIISQHHLFYPSHEPYECDVEISMVKTDSKN